MKYVPKEEGERETMRYVIAYRIGGGDRGQASILDYLRGGEEVPRLFSPPFPKRGDRVLGRGAAPGP